MVSKRIITSRQILQEEAEKRALTQGEPQTEELFPSTFCDNDFTRISRTEDKMENFLKPNGSLLFPNYWFLDVHYFCGGFAAVRTVEDDAWGFINMDGKFITDLKFSYVEDFSEGYALVQRGLDEMYNFLKPDGTFLSEVWFQNARSFQNGFAAVNFGDQQIPLWNFIRQDGSRFNNINYRWVKDFTKMGYAIVDWMYNVNILTREGNYLSSKWYYRIDNYQDDYFRVRRDPTGENDQNLLKLDGTLLSKRWFPYMEAISHSHGFAIVQRSQSEKCNIVKPDGNLLWKNWKNEWAFDIQFEGIVFRGNRNPKEAMLYTFGELLEYQEG